MCCELIKAGSGFTIIIIFEELFQLLVPLLSNLNICRNYKNKEKWKHFAFSHKIIKIGAFLRILQKFWCSLPKWFYLQAIIFHAMTQKQRIDAKNFDTLTCGLNCDTQKLKTKKNNANTKNIFTNSNFKAVAAVIHWEVLRCEIQGVEEHLDTSKGYNSKVLNVFIINKYLTEWGYVGLIHDYMDLHRELHPVDVVRFLKRSLVCSLSVSLPHFFCVCLCMRERESVSLNETENCVQPEQNNHNHILTKRKCMLCIKRIRYFCVRWDKI